MFTEKKGDKSWDKLEQLSEQPLATEELNFLVSQPTCTHLLN